ncbi:MAG: ABC transporter ATP-binding protein [Acidimicrobiia bacterium]
MNDTAAPVLEVEGLEVHYGEARAVFGVDLKIASGEVLAVLGPNGAGKSSLAAAITGRVSPAAGTVRIAGQDVTKSSAADISRLGVAYVPEERAIFPHLSVADNLRVLLRYAVPRDDRAAAVERALELFPVLGERRRQQAGTLSGGEQQMLSLARMLAAPPKLLIADEMSLGLAPRLVDLVFDSLRRAREEGVTILLIEQYVERALGIANDAVILRRGRIGWSGPASEAHAELVAGYLGSES